MKKVFLLTFLFLAALTVSAQKVTATSAPVSQVIKQPQLRFGYVSCDSVLHALPDYGVAMKSLKDLRAKYDAEMKRVEDEFNSKYELFLEGQKDFAPSIRQKRQAELQELMGKNIAFKKEAEDLLSKASKDAVTPLKKTIQATITRIGQQKGLAFVVNTDVESMPYLNTTMGVDITEEVIKASR